MSKLRLARFSVLFPRLTMPMGSLIWLAGLLFSGPQRHSLDPIFMYNGLIVASLVIGNPALDVSISL